MSIEALNPTGNNHQNIRDLRTSGPNSDVRVFSATTGKLLRIEKYDGTPLPVYNKPHQVKTSKSKR